MAWNNTTAVGVDHPAANGPRLLLAEHHREIEAACDDLRASTYEDDSFDLIACYRSFEQAVREHMSAEEDVILPAYAKADPEEADAIRTQHAALRHELYQLGVEVELHCVHAESLEQMVRTLRAHAGYEDQGMYPWAQVHLPLHTSRELFVRLGRSLRKLAQRRRYAASQSPGPAAQH